MEVGEVRRQEEAARGARAVSQAQQGQWMRRGWHREKENHLKRAVEHGVQQASFITTYDVLPSLANLHLWLGEDPACLLCTAPTTLKHILVGSKICLSQ